MGCSKIYRDDLGGGRRHLGVVDSLTLVGEADARELILSGLEVGHDLVDHGGHRDPVCALGMGSIYVEVMKVVCRMYV